MANFEEAFEKVIEIEGGYVDDPDDRGGPTNFGISSRFLKRIGDKRDPKDLIKKEVEELYKEYFWKFNGVFHQNVANKIFDISVNIGLENTTRLIQMTVNKIVKREELIVDKICGPKTIGCLNKLSACTFLTWFRLECVRHYVYICLNDKTQFKYLLGWLDKRALS